MFRNSHPVPPIATSGRGRRQASRSRLRIVRQDGRQARSTSRSQKLCFQTQSKHPSNGPEALRRVTCENCSLERQNRLPPDEYQEVGCTAGRFTFSKASKSSLALIGLEI